MISDLTFLLFPMARKGTPKKEWKYASKPKARNTSAIALSFNHYKELSLIFQPNQTTIRNSALSFNHYKELSLIFQPNHYQELIIEKPLELESLFTIRVPLAGSAYPPLRTQPKKNGLCVGESREEHHKQLELSPTTLEIPNKSSIDYYNPFKEIDKVIVFFESRKWTTW